MATLAPVCNRPSITGEAACAREADAREPDIPIRETLAIIFFSASLYCPIVNRGFIGDRRGDAAQSCLSISEIGARAGRTLEIIERRRRPERILATERRVLI